MSNSSKEETKYALGPDYALQEAIDILGPYPWKRPDALPIANWIIELPELVTREAIRFQIGRIARFYRRDLDTDKQSPRRKATAKKYKDIAAKATQLAKILKSLTHIERVMLVEYFQPGQDVDTWQKQIYQQLPSVGFPIDPDLPHGPGVQWLDYLAHHADSAISQLVSTDRPGGISDVGGQTNINRLRRAPPSWMLMKMCWQLFEWAPHQQPSGTVDKPFHSFVCYVHEWVTGEPVVNTHAFENYLKRFPKPWKRHLELTEELYQLRETLPSHSQEIFSAVFYRRRDDLSNQLPDKILAKGKKLISEYSSIQELLTYGPRAAIKR